MLKVTACMGIAALTINTSKIVDAYVFNGYPVSQPTSVGFSCNNAAYESKINTYAKQWNQCSELYLYPTTSAGAIVHSSVSAESSGSYATTYYYGNDNKSIVFFQSWQTASESIKNETVVHEFGHAVGLSHTQSVNDSNAVMREYGFNNKAYPLSDDKAGIAALY